MSLQLKLLYKPPLDLQNKPGSCETLENRSSVLLGHWLRRPRALWAQGSSRGCCCVEVEVELTTLQDPWGRRIHVVGNAAVDAREACMCSW